MSFYVDKVYIDRYESPSTKIQHLNGFLCIFIG